MSFGNAHTPALMDDIVIAVADHEWLATLGKKLLASDDDSRRQIRALEYFYRAWFLDAPERFPILLMALDAVFGDVAHATQALIDAVRSIIGAHIPEARLRALSDLRAVVIHGAAPDVYDARKYVRYYDKFDADPIRDLELIAQRCLRLRIFGDAMKLQKDPHAAVIAAAQAKGLYPKTIDLHQILQEFVRL